MTFRDKVYDVVTKIPKGSVMSYKEVATAAGKPKAARAVGYFMKTNPFAPRVPCHRVIKSDGSVGGYSGTGGSKGKLKLLLSEGWLPFPQDFRQK
jgi:methylated-DNA-[protein]-cysteine S-methyltransferase